MDRFAVILDALTMLARIEGADGGYGALQDAQAARRVLLRGTGVGVLGSGGWLVGISRRNGRR